MDSPVNILFWKCLCSWFSQTWSSKGTKWQNWYVRCHFKHPHTFMKGTKRARTVNVLFKCHTLKADIFTAEYVILLNAPLGQPSLYVIHFTWHLLSHILWETLRKQQQKQSKKVCLKNSSVSTVCLGEIVRIIYGAL